MNQYEEPRMGRKFYWADDVHELLREVIDADDGYTLGDDLIERIQAILRDADSAHNG